MNEFIGKWRQFIVEEVADQRVKFEIGDTVVMKGDELKGEELIIIDKRTLFGSDLQAFTVQSSNGMGRSEYDETQLVKIGGVEDRAARTSQFNDGNEFEDEYVDDPSNPLGEPGDLDTDDVLDGMLDENLAEGKELDVIETDNRDSKYTILRLSNGDYVEVNVIELYQNLMDNQSDDENLAEMKSLNESAPGYNTRKFGHPLPTLESIQSAYEAKEKPRDGVQSAAEKLGMKPSHVKEDSFSGAEIDPNVELYSNDAVDWDFEESIKKIIDELKEYQKVNPQDDLQTAINHLEYLIYA
jgi:hypothetical protein